MQPQGKARVSGMAFFTAKKRRKKFWRHGYFFGAGVTWDQGKQVAA